MESHYWDYADCFRSNLAFGCDDPLTYMLHEAPTALLHGGKIKPYGLTCLSCLLGQITPACFQEQKTSPTAIIWKRNETNSIFKRCLSWSNLVYGIEWFILLNHKEQLRDFFGKSYISKGWRAGFPFPWPQRVYLQSGGMPSLPQPCVCSGCPWGFLVRSFSPGNKEDECLFFFFFKKVAL